MSYFEEREANIYLIAKYIFKHWKHILLVAFICAIMGFGLGYKKYKTLQSSNNGKSNASEIELEELFNSLTPDEQNRVEYVVLLNDRLKSLKEYMDNSPFMKIDPFNIPVAILQYNITPKTNSYTTELEKLQIINNLKSEYYDYIENGEMASQLLKLYAEDGLSERLINDLVDASFDSQLFGSSIISVTIKKFHESPDFETNIDRLIKDMSKVLSKSFGDHQIDYIKVSNTYIKSDYILDLQEKIRARYDSTRNSIRSMQVNGELSDAAILYYERKIGEDGYHLGIEGNINNSTPSKKSIIKYMILFIGVGVFASCLILCIYYILFVFEKYIVTTNDYSFLKIKYLGDMKKGSQLNRIVSKIYGYCYRNHINQIALLSTDMSMIDVNTIDDLRNELLIKNIDGVIISKDDVNDNTYMEQLLSINHCLLIEKMNYTEVKGLQELVDNCNDNDIHIIGVVNEC